jgi:hypothetical protein
MIINPCTSEGKELLIPYAGTRLLQHDFGLVGTAIPDPAAPARYWRVQSLYAPIEGRSIGGFRTKLVDEKGFVAFLHQMDLEVLVGVARPGQRCRWSGQVYMAPDERGFCGFCCDDDDLRDDLYDREMLLRAESVTGFLPPNHEILRRVHLEDRVDIEELHILLWDADPETGIGPDIRISTLDRRWVRVERLKAPWEDM